MCFFFNSVEYNEEQRSIEEMCIYVRMTRKKSRHDIDIH